MKFYNIKRDDFMKFTAAGDALIQQRIPKDYEGFDKIRQFVERGDARFFNLETTLHPIGTCYASEFSGGTYMRTNPESLDDLLRYGFNMTSFNNNHTMDFSYDGMLKTLECLNQHDIAHSGVGKNLREASAPCYLDTKEGRVALISVNTSFDSSMMAGEQSRRFPGRPGINGLRHTETYYVTQDDFETIQRISDSTGINDTEKLHIAQGYAKAAEDGVFQMGPLRFSLGEKSGRVSTCNEEDVARILQAIYEAKLQANYIMISIHTHQVMGDANENVPGFIEEFAHRCIDAGAHAIIGHGPHLLRPIEVYKNRPIFYSLGDFIMQLYSVEAAPEEFYHKQGLTSDATVHELLKKRSNDFTRGLMEDKVMSETVIPYWEMENGELTKLELMPVTCRKCENKSLSGLPVEAKDTYFVERLAKLSAPYGVKMHFSDGIIKCEW